MGVAMGAGGSAMATEAADIVMMSDNIVRIPETLSICRMGRAIIIQNCTLAIAIKIAAVVVAVLGYLQFWQAVLIDIGTLLLVVANGTRPLGLETFERNMNKFRSAGSDGEAVVVVIESASEEGEDETTQLQSLVNSSPAGVQTSKNVDSVSGQYQMVPRRPRSVSGEASVLLPLRENEKPTP